MKMLACDDDALSLKYLQQVFHDYEKKMKCKIAADFFTSAEQLLFELNGSYPYDLIILDIQMTKMNGIDLAKQIRTVDQTVPIVFLTGVSDFVFEGYEVNAFRYLMKPLKEEALFKILNYFFTLPKENKHLLIMHKGQTFKLNLNELIYAEAMGHYIKLKTKDNVFEIKQSFSNLLNELKDNRFVQCHRSYIVNCSFIEAIKKEEILLTTKENLPISRSCYNNVNQVFIQYYRGRDL